MTEVLTYPFIGPERFDQLLLPADCTRRDAVRVLNPLNDALPLLRTTVLSSLVDAVRVNLGRGLTDVALFEVGRAYRADGSRTAPRPPLVMSSGYAVVR